MAQRFHRRRGRGGRRERERIRRFCKPTWALLQHAYWRMVRREGACTCALVPFLWILPEAERCKQSIMTIPHCELLLASLQQPLSSIIINIWPHCAEQLRVRGMQCLVERLPIALGGVARGAYGTGFFERPPASCSITSMLAPHLASQQT
jgi:hypothetical protein